LPTSAFRAGPQAGFGMSLFKTLADDQHNEYAMIDHRQGAPAPARAPQKGEYDQPIGRSRGGLDKNPRDRRRAWHSRSVSTLATLTTSRTRNR